MMRVLLRDTRTHLFVGPKQHGIPLRVHDRREAHDFLHVPWALDASRDLAGRERLEIILDFGDPEYDLCFHVEAVGRRLGERRADF